MSSVNCRTGAGFETKHTVLSGADPQCPSPGIPAAQLIQRSCAEAVVVQRSPEPSTTYPLGDGAYLGDPASPAGSFDHFRPLSTGRRPQVPSPLVPHPMSFEFFEKLLGGRSLPGTSHAFRYPSTAYSKAYSTAYSTDLFHSRSKRYLRYLQQRENRETLNYLTILLLR